MVLVDTTIWSLALRRRHRDLGQDEQRLVGEWVRLVKAGKAVLVGPVRQEILSGIRHESDFVAIQQRLSVFGYLEIMPGDYDEAAAFFNICRAHGVAATAIDMLICAVAARLRVPIFTTDTDFVGYARYLPISLHVVR